MALDFEVPGSHAFHGTQSDPYLEYIGGEDILGLNDLRHAPAITLDLTAGYINRDKGEYMTEYEKRMPSSLNKAPVPLDRPSVSHANMAGRMAQLYDTSEAFTSTLGRKKLPAPRRGLDVKADPVSMPAWTHRAMQETEPDARLFLRLDDKDQTLRFHAAGNLEEMPRIRNGEHTHLVFGMPELKNQVYHGGVQVNPPRNHQEIHTTMEEGIGADPKYQVMEGSTPNMDLGQQPFVHPHQISEAPIFDTYMEDIRIMAPQTEHQHGFYPSQQADDLVANYSDQGGWM